MDGFVTQQDFMPLILSSIAAAFVWRCIYYLVTSFTLNRRLSPYKVVNSGGICGLSSQNSVGQWINDSANLIAKGFHKNTKAFRVNTDFAQVLVLSPIFADELRNKEHLSSGEFTQNELMGFIPGFEPFAFAGVQGRELMHNVITLRLNRALRQSIIRLNLHFFKWVTARTDQVPPKAMITGCLSVEVTDSLIKSWTESTEWHQVPLHQTMLRLVTQASIRVFLGPELCRNERWIDINMQYAVIAMGAVKDLRKYPRPLVNIFHWFHPAARKTRALMREARTILKPIYEKKVHERDMHRKKHSSSEDAKALPATDSLGWFEDMAKDKQYDPTVAQLTFAVAAMHATTDLLVQVIIDLAQHGEVVAALRAELVEVISKEGWQQSAFSRLRLMDSVLKESQRLKPVSRVFNKRVATADIQLHAGGGIIIPKGTYVAMSAIAMRDPAVYPDPDVFDAYRFIKRANDPSLAKSCSFIAATPEHMGFGFGKTACPGRVYVALELKILLAHIILKYDFKMPDGYSPVIFSNGFDTITDVLTNLDIRRRAEEFSLPA